MAADGGEKKGAKDGFWKDVFSFFKDVLSAVKSTPLLAILWGFGVLFLVIFTVTLTLAGELPPLGKIGLVALIVLDLTFLFVYTTRRIPTLSRPQEPPVGPKKKPLGLFLDVDKTLSDGVVQQYYARHLGCEGEFQKIEEGWNDEKKNANQFGESLIELFSMHGFTKEKAQEIAKAVPLQPWADKLLALPVDIYLVSSGPNYYVRSLASKYRIPDENVICSEYHFDGANGLISKCDSVSPDTKATFTEGKTPEYLLTIGVGDDPTKDGPFISKCTLPILTKTHHPNTYLVGTDIEMIINLISKIQMRLQSEGEHA